MKTQVAILFVTLILLTSSQNPTAPWSTQTAGVWGGTCDSGTKQSPIDIQPKDSTYCSASELNHVQFSCIDFANAAGTAGMYRITANDGALTIVDSTFSSIISKAVGTSQHIQFHAPGEHTIKGVSYPLEVQIVFANLASSAWKGKIEGSNVATVTQFTNAQVVTRLTVGNPTATSAAVIVSFLFEADTSITNTDILGLTAGQTNLKTIFDCTSSRFFYRYTGSYTTPPCTEGVEWLVSREPIKISQTEINAIKAKLTANNNRNVKTLGTRVVRIAGAPCHPSTEL